MAAIQALGIECKNVSSSPIRPEDGDLCLDGVFDLGPVARRAGPRSLRRFQRLRNGEEAFGVWVGINPELIHERVSSCAIYGACGIPPSRKAIRGRGG